METFEFLETYFPFILLTIVIILALLVITSIFNINFSREKKKKLTRKVTFASGI